MTYSSSLLFYSVLQSRLQGRFQGDDPMRIPLPKERQHAVLRVKLRKPPAEKGTSNQPKKQIL